MMVEVDDIIKMPEAEVLADWYLIFLDLDIAINVLEKLKVLLEKEDGERDEILETSLWVHALGSYARCFRTGVRLRLDKSILKDLSGCPIKAHDHFINMRDKHIAHSVNPFEQVKIGAIVKDKKEVIGITKISIKNLHFELDGVRNLMLLANRAKEHSIQKVKEYEQIVFDLCKKIPIEELNKSSGPLKITVPGPEDAKISRKDYKK